MLNRRLPILIAAILAGCFYVFLSKRDKSQKINTELAHALDKDNIIPVAILGSGPAGQSAAIYSARLGFKTLVVEGDKAGGQLTGTSYVENWPGEKKILGATLMQNLKEQNLGLGVAFLADTITKVNFKVWPFELYTADGAKINALSVIIATGSSPRILKIPGETEYWGKGVTTCAICDAPFYKGKPVVVIGGGDSAIEEALQLAPHASQITMLVRKESFRASQSMRDRLKTVNNITVLYNKELTKVIGDSHVNAVEILDNKTKQVTTMPISGVFLAIGHEPNTKLFKDQLDFDKSGYIKVSGRSQKTSVPGVFAAGDVEDYVYMQAGVASGAGIKAALDAGSFLHKIGFTPEVAAKIKYFDSMETGPSRVISISQPDEFEKEVSNSKIPVILDFWAKHCPSCIHMLPSFESLSKKFYGKMKFVKIDTDKSEELVKKLYVLKVPSFIVYKNGQIAARYHDFMDKSQMTDFVTKFID